MIQKTHHGAYGLIIRNDEVLLIKKSRGPYTGKWDLPGGRIEFGESIEEALIREIKEETNLEVKNYTFHATESFSTQYLNSLGKEVHFHHLGIIYLVSIKDDCAALLSEADGHDSMGAAWTKLNTLSPQELSPFAKNSLSSYLAKK